MFTHFSFNLYWLILNKWLGFGQNIFFLSFLVGVTHSDLYSPQLINNLLKEDTIFEKLGISQYVKYKVAEIWQKIENKVDTCIKEPLIPKLTVFKFL